MKSITKIMVSFRFKAIHKNSRLGLPGYIHAYMSNSVNTLDIVYHINWVFITGCLKHQQL